MEEQMIHIFGKPIAHIARPEKFTYPFQYTPHPLCVLAAEEVKNDLASRKEWQEELSWGKMFGVLVVELPTSAASGAMGELGYLAAFSGNLAGKNRHAHFVPPVYDLLQPQGFFRKEEEKISAINIRIGELEGSASYTEAKEKWKMEMDRAAGELARAKAIGKEAKEARERRRQCTVELSEEEEAEMIRESQHQKATYKRLEKEWKRRIEEAKTEIDRFEKEIEQLKEERKERSAALQRRLFGQFAMLNARGEVKDLCTIFEQTVCKIPPGGAGECALPKLLQYAYLHGLKPLAMAEFWWGRSPKNEIRKHGYYYPSCKGKCEPILQHMLQGLEVEENPLLARPHQDTELDIIFEDDWLVVVNKPTGMLSVPGKDQVAESVYQWVKRKYPNATGPLMVHRLDMATSGLLIVVKSKEAHQHLQVQFERRTVRKRYIALLDGNIEEIDNVHETGEADLTAHHQKEILMEKTGRIELPLCLNPLDRPRQMVNHENGKPAITDYRILGSSDGQTRIAFYPLTGRTHQLRVHAAHPQGLGHPIIGDELYGKKADRLYLHAEYIEFRHPIYGDIICLQKEADF